MKNEPKVIVPNDLIQVIADIDEFKGRWTALEGKSPERLGALRKIATIESVGSSTRIEGAKLSDAQVETLLAGLKAQSLETRDEQEVAGYAQAMDLVFEAYEDLRLTENHIRQIHLTLLRHCTKDERHRGSYKTLPNHVVAFDADGKEIGVVFATTSPFDTPREMEELLAWTNKAIEEEAHHPLVIVAIFTVVFLAIHPFQDGNGRLSRVLTTLLLLRAGYSYVPFASLESVVELNKELYYRALRRTQSTLRGEQPDWLPWLGFFLRSLRKQKNRLLERLAEHEVEQCDESQLSELAMQILTLIRIEQRQSISQLVEATGANRNTVKVRLRELVVSGLIAQHGKARATWYSA